MKSNAMYKLVVLALEVQEPQQVSHINGNQAGDSEA
jgi:hypothetical protein